jgi:signal transduction histidine kinase
VDPIRFEQLVTILLDNAVRYNPAGGEIGVILADDGAAGIRLTVEDEGVGIPADERARIFERHQPASSSEHLAGMGLGLFVARQIVEQHGGTIHVEQPDHAGARFVVQLPAQPPAA